jgi:hypothetical protein
MKDNLSKIINTDNNSERINSFAWISIAAINSDFSNLNSDSRSQRDLMADYLHKDQSTAQKIADYIKNRLIPDQDLNWISESHRQALWLERYIASNIMQGQQLISNQNITTSKSPLSKMWRFAIPFHLTGKNRSTALFDYWTAFYFLRMQDRIDKSKDMQLAWENSIESDKFFIWLDADNAEKKRASFWIWLKQKYPEITQDHPSFHSHEELLIFFDNLRFTDSDKQMFSQNYRKIWNQQRQRESANGKKQTNFVLSEKTISNLSMLAQKHGLTRTEIIEILIESEAKDEIYISKRLNRIAALTTPI